MERLKDAGADINEAPESNFIINFYLSAYWTLTRSRNHAGSIPLSEIILWAELNRVDDIHELITWVYALNDEHLDFENTKLQAQMNAQKAQQGVRSGRQKR